MVTWLHNGSAVMTTSNNLTQIGNTTTTTLLIENILPSDAGIYWCVFNDTVNGLILKRASTMIFGSKKFH